VVTTLLFRWLTPVLSESARNVVITHEAVLSRTTEDEYKKGKTFNE